MRDDLPRGVAESRFPVRMLPPASAGLLLSLAAALATAQPMPDLGGDPLPSEIRWRGFDSRVSRRAAVTSAAEYLQQIGPDRKHFVIQLSTPPTAAQRAALASAGLRLLRPLGADSYFAVLTTAFRADTPLPIDSGFLVFDIEPAWKLHPLLQKAQPPDWIVIPAAIDPASDTNSAQASSGVDPSARPDVLVALYVVFHEDVLCKTAGRALLTDLGARLRSAIRTVNTLVVELPFGAVHALARADIVQWVEPALPPLTGTNAANRALVGADLVQDAPYGLDGTGVSALVFDAAGVFADHPDFGDRVTVIDGSFPADHATHVAGTLGGDGSASDGLHRGMAPNVSILSAQVEFDPNSLFLYTDPGDIEQDYDLAINGFAADIANNSLGSNVDGNGFSCTIQGDYGVTAALLDGIVRGALGRPLPVVFAAGNERPGNRCNVEGFGPYYSIAPPAANKNTITVGAINANNEAITGFSSWGPTDDGRLRPDLCAPGCQSDDDFGVTSTLADGGYGALCGTSMAAPTVTGLGALLIQDFRAQFPSEPDLRSATLKALLAHTAVDLGNPGPDFRFGYGSVRIEPAVRRLRSHDWLEDELDQGATHAYFIIVDPNDTTLKVTLAWDDQPGTPNVVPALVNDLDLSIYDPAGGQLFPWTLNPMQPDAAAVRSRPDHHNNMEQVVVDQPVPGVYRVEVRGFRVAAGPQAFSLVSSGPLNPCSSTGAIFLDRSAYACESVAAVQVVDCDLNTNDQIIETVDVLLSSDSEPTGESLLLTATGPDSPVFQGVLPLSALDQPGLLLVSTGDVVTATYTDADDGRGGANTPRISRASIVCGPPLDPVFEVLEITANRALVGVRTAEPTQVLARYGPQCAAPTDQALSAEFSTSHTLVLRELDPATQYFVTLELADQAGATTIDDNGGACFTFSSRPAPQPFTEEFLFEFDIENTAIRFVPDGSGASYRACARSISALPVPPLDGAPLDIQTNDFVRIPLLDNKAVYLYGKRYDELFVGSNGSITFGIGDRRALGGPPIHFDLPRVSALQTALDPNSGGTIRWQQLPDRAVVTWNRVPTLNTGARNTMQVEMFFDGQIEIALRRIGAFYGLCGLSPGGGTPADFKSTDLSDQADCAVPGRPFAIGFNAKTTRGDPLTLELVAFDDGAPGPLVYTLLSLPAQPLRNAQTNQIILDADLPLTLDAGAATVVYEPAPSFIGVDTFQFIADDGGVAPDGGPSATATVEIRVEPLRNLPWFEDFADPAFDPNTWRRVNTATIDAASIEPPSPPLAARFNGDPNGGDRIESQRIDLSGLGPVLFEYYWQRTGGGDSPIPGADLELAYFSSKGEWVELIAHDGDGPDMQAFEFERLYVPPDALHQRFALRIRSSADIGPFHDWFIDDLSLRPSTEPLAIEGFATTLRFTPVEIQLEGFDPEDQPLEFIITTLPPRGSLRDPQAGPIANVPYTLLGGGSAVEYLPLPRAAGQDRFAFAVDDGAFRSLPEPVHITIELRQLLFGFPLDADPGWNMDPGWAFGPPAGTDLPGEDPSSAFSGAFVYGFVLGGNYPDNLPEARYLTTSALNFTGRTGVELDFYRWLNIASFGTDQATIEVSSDGVQWTPVWRNDTGFVTDEEWTVRQVDLAEWADGRSSVQVRWGLGPTNSFTNFGGWNIDDVQFWADEPPCPADLDGSLVIDVPDLQMLLDVFGLRPALPENGDIDADGDVDLTDLARLLAAFGEICPG